MPQMLNRPTGDGKARAPRSYNSLSEVEREFLEICTSIIGRVPYVDKLTTATNKLLTRDHIGALRKLNGDRVNVRTNRPYEYKGERHRPTYWREIDLKQPTDAATHFLNMVAGKHVNVYIELAIDELFHSRAEAQRARDFFKRHHTQLWPGKRRRNEIDGLVYLSSDSRTGRQHVFYADRKTKTDNDLSDPDEARWCLHFEVRLQTQNGAIRRAGAQTLPELRSLDFRALFAQQLRLVEITRPAALNAAIDRRILRRARRFRRNAERRDRCMYKLQPFIDRAERRLRRALGISATQQWHEADVHLLKQFMPKALRNKTKNLDVSPLLPAPRHNDRDATLHFSKLTTLNSQEVLRGHNRRAKPRRRDHQVHSSPNAVASTSVTYVAIPGSRIRRAVLVS